MKEKKRILTEKEQKVAIDFLEELIFANTPVPDQSQKQPERKTLAIL